MLELPAQSVDAKLGAHLPHRIKMRAPAQEVPDDFLALEHAPLADLDEVARGDVLVEVVHLPFPVTAARYPRVHGQPVIHPRIPVGVEADDADIAFGPLRDRLGDGVRATR